MNCEYQYLHKLLCAYLQEYEVKSNLDIDWQKLIHLAHIHNVLGILGYMTMKYPICPDENLRRSLRQICLNTISVYTNRANKMGVLIQQLNQAGIDHILMKGYIIREYYPVPEMRTFGDIDFVIRQEDREKTHALMLGLGYQPKNDWEPVYSYVREDEFYEIHSDIMEVDVSDKADYKGYFRQMWTYAQLMEGHTYHFTPEFHFLYLIAHLAKHVQSAGAGIRMYLDIAAFLQHFENTLNWDFIQKELHALKLEVFTDTIMTAVEEWFGATCPFQHQRPEPAVMNEFCNFTMEAGIFGKYNRETAINTLKRESDHKSRFSTFVSRAFPSAETIKTRYTYLQDKPWLLPAAWVHRFIKTKRSFIVHAHEAHVLMTADGEEVRRLQTLMQKIGL
ncbi:MAG: nucleotidyltransferase family protein [Clostridia bacterium]|nr:nucleotidyltransferase family protein [Clostridia bacterium]